MLFTCHGKEYCGLANFMANWDKIFAFTLKLDIIPYKGR